MDHRAIRIRPRYTRRLTDPGVELKEANCSHVQLDWEIPIGQAALVCVDVWDRDLHTDMRREDDRVTRERIVPVLAACRRAGVLVIHAPAWPTAEREANWVGLVDHTQAAPPWPDSPAWPPQDFRARVGPYAQYARPREPRAAECDQVANPPGFHPLVRPVGDEPVIGVGEELHRLCARRGVLHLVYVGFHTPGCMTGRTYGLPAMHRYGYTCILLRDCTNGMETHETWPDRTSMRGCIAFLEQTGIYTLTSEQFIDGLPQPPAS